MPTVFPLYSIDPGSDVDSPQDAGSYEIILDEAGNRILDEDNNPITE